MQSAVRQYYRLAKPGIVYGNTFSLIAGYFYCVAAGGSFSILSFAYAVVGTALVMGSACAANNIIDRDIDIYMKRTKERSLVTGKIKPLYAGIFSAVLVAIGLALLALINLTVVLLAIVGWILYVIPYTYLKRVTYHATLVGTLPGAVPPLIGYYAAGGTSLTVAIILFLILVTWQMVHFYAIAIFRHAEYAAANVPIITVVKGIDTTVSHMQVWAILSALTLALSIFYADLVYAVLVTALVGWWLRATVYDTDDPIKWSRKVFFSSLLFLVLWMASTLIPVVL